MRTPLEGNSAAPQMADALKIAQKAVQNMTKVATEPEHAMPLLVATENLAIAQAQALATVAVAEEIRALTLATLYAADDVPAGVNWGPVAAELRARLNLPEKGPVTFPEDDG